MIEPKLYEAGQIWCNWFQTVAVSIDHPSIAFPLPSQRLFHQSICSSFYVKHILPTAIILLRFTSRFYLFSILTVIIYSPSLTWHNKGVLPAAVCHYMSHQVVSECIEVYLRVTSRHCYVCVDGGGTAVHRMVTEAPIAPVQFNGQCKVSTGTVDQERWRRWMRNQWHNIFVLTSAENLTMPDRTFCQQVTYLYPVDTFTCTPPLGH
jgi:hypothetical protein